MSHGGHLDSQAERLIEDGVKLGLAGYALENELAGKDPARHGVVGQAAHVGGMFVVYGFVLHWIVVPYLIATAVVMALPAGLYELLIPIRANGFGGGTQELITAPFVVLLALGVVGWVALQVWWVLRLRRPRDRAPGNWVWAVPYLIVSGVLVNLPMLIWAFAVRQHVNDSGRLGTLPPGFWVLAAVLLAVWLYWPVYKWAYTGGWFANEDRRRRAAGTARHASGRQSPARASRAGPGVARGAGGRPAAAAPEARRALDELQARWRWDAGDLVAAAGALWPFVDGLDFGWLARAEIAAVRQFLAGADRYDPGTREAIAQGLAANVKAKVPGLPGGLLPAFVLIAVAIFAPEDPVAPAGQAATSPGTALIVPASTAPAVTRLTRAQRREALVRLDAAIAESAAAAPDRAVGLAVRALAPFAAEVDISLLGREEIAEIAAFLALADAGERWPVAPALDELAGRIRAKVRGLPRGLPALFTLVAIRLASPHDLTAPVQQPADPPRGEAGDPLDAATTALEAAAGQNVASDRHLIDAMQALAQHIDSVGALDDQEREMASAFLTQAQRLGDGPVRAAAARLAASLGRTLDPDPGRRNAACDGQPRSTPVRPGRAVPPPLPGGPDVNDVASLPTSSDRGGQPPDEDPDPPGDGTGSQ